MSLDGISSDVRADLRIRIEQHRAKVLVDPRGVVPESLADERTRPVADELARDVELSTLRLHICVKVHP